MEEKTKLIGDLDFKGTRVKIYSDPRLNKDDINYVWQIRNPDTCYQGYMYIDNETGQISYPEDAVVPEQTDKDREMLPKFIITGHDRIDDNFISFLLSKLEQGYKMRNRF